MPLGFFDYLFQDTASKSVKYSLGSQPGGAIEIPIFMEFSAFAVSPILQMEFTVTILYGFSPVFLLYEIVIQLTPSFHYHVSLLFHP